MSKFLIIIKRQWAVLTLIILVAITLLSFWPLDELPQVPGSDKIHHLVAYAILMLPTAIRKPDNWILFGLLFIFYSGAVELIQPYVNRYGEWMDMLANTAGIICGVFIAELINLYISSKHKYSR